MALKKSGYDGLLISGKSETPSYLYIDTDEVKIKDASHLWGKDINDSQKVLDVGRKGGTHLQSNFFRAGSACCERQHRAAQRRY